MENREEYYSREELSEVFGVSILTIDNWRISGKLDGVKNEKGKYFFHKEPVNVLLHDEIEILKMRISIIKSNEIDKLSKKLKYLQSKL